MKYLKDITTENITKLNDLFHAVAELISDEFVCL